MMRRILIGFLLVSLSVGVWGFYELVREARALFWKEVPALVTKSATRFGGAIQVVKKNLSPSDRTWYLLNLDYRYSVDGLDYTSSRISLIDTPLWNLKSAEAMVTKYPVGATVVAYVSPDDPALAILEPGPSPATIILLLGSILAALGTGWLLRGFPTSHRRRR